MKRVGQENNGRRSKRTFVRRIAVAPVTAATLVAAAVAMALAAWAAGCAQAARSQCTLPSDCGLGETCINGRCVADHSIHDAAWPQTPDGSVPDEPDAAPDPDGEVTCAEASFEMTETQEVFEVPQNVTYMHVKAWGAGGNGEGQCTFNDGGIGGYSEAVFAVQPGTPLIVIVGKRGRAGTTNEDIVRFGFGHWGGGGLSGVFLGSDPITESDNTRALVIAGGGGGASAPGCNPGGTGNHPNAGGMPTMMGGQGADDVNGGAGGYVGGTGGPRGIGGTGGTGFIASSAVDSVMLYAQTGDNVPPRSTDPDYDGIAGQEESSGRVVIHFVCEPPPVQ